jgi:hypothetical protein
MNASTVFDAFGEGGDAGAFELMACVTCGRAMRSRGPGKCSGYGMIDYFSERKKFTATFSSAPTVTFFSQVLGSEKTGR